MDDVAQAAGVSRLIVYRNFESKEDLYRAVLRSVLVDLGEQFAGLSFEDVARHAARRRSMLPVARAHPDAFRLLWRHAWHEPSFADVAVEFRVVRARSTPGRILQRVHRRRAAPRLGGAHAPAPTSSRASATGSTSATRPATTSSPALMPRRPAGRWPRRGGHRPADAASDVDDPVDLLVGDDERRAERQRVGADRPRDHPARRASGRGSPRRPGRRAARPPTRRRRRGRGRSCRRRRAPAARRRGARRRPTARSTSAFALHDRQVGQAAAHAAGWPEYVYPWRRTYAGSASSGPRTALADEDAAERLVARTSPPWRTSSGRARRRSGRRRTTCRGGRSR